MKGKLQTRIPVEHIEEDRLTNIERRIVIGAAERAPESVPHRGFAYAAGSLLAVATAAVVGWKLHSPPAIAPVAVVSQHFSVAAGARITVDGATLGGAASYEVTRTPERVAIELQHGSLDLAVVHDPHRVLVIHAGDTEIEDIGTRFRVEFHGASTVAVRVTEGEVQVTRRGQVARVSAGNAWTTEGGLVALAVLEAPTRVASADPVTPPVVALRVATSPVVVRHEPVARPIVTVAPHVAPRPMPIIATVDPYVELRTAIRTVPLEFAPAIDGHADAATEIAKLKKVAYSPTTLGPEASAATYQIAVLLYRPLGQDAEALNTLEIYRRRFSGGKELHAAQWLRVRIECSHAVDEACRRAAYSYQHEVTSGVASDVAIRITNAQ
ncbi:hypothetical protein BH11MYX1_BH11MYX1_18430 [soil metagenome]